MQNASRTCPVPLGVDASRARIRCAPLRSALWLAGVCALASACSLERDPTLDQRFPEIDASTDAGPDGGEPGDPCARNNGGCSPLVSCSVVDAGAVCGQCPDGTADTRGDGSECTDIDECELGTHECDINPRARCINTMGGYLCRCPAGTFDVSGDGRNCMIDPNAPIDECERDLHDCDDDPQATCIDTPTSFECICPEGYEDPATLGRNCVDIDECERGLANCDSEPPAACENTEGSFTCTCPPGYEDVAGDGTDCVEIDECALGTDTCDDDPDACVDGIDSYTCVCPEGYEDTLGDGSVCTDIDECLAGTDRCDDEPVASCENTIGGHTCTCPAGFVDPLGDGSVCMPPAMQVAIGAQHTCAIVEGGAVKCWGRNFQGQLGQGNTIGVGALAGQTGSALPTVDLGGPVVALAAGCDHNCALTRDGEVKCWGLNSSGQLGVGDAVNRGNAPGHMGENLATVPLANPARSITAGCDFSCALLVTDEALCWGDNEHGQLGQGATDDRGDAPLEVAALDAIDLNAAALELHAGANFVCARLTGNTLKCWGRNQDGQLGQNDIQNRGDNPGEMGAALPAINLGGGRTVTTFAPGFSHACALLDNGTVKCWGGEREAGIGYGEANINRGDGITQPGEMPGMEMGNLLPAVELTGTVVSMSAQRHTCVLRNDGSILCFGNNSAGELGLGDTQARGNQPGQMGASLPAVDLGTGARALAVFTGTERAQADANTCALLDTGALKCWGAGAGGQLGLGDERSRGDGPGEMGDALPATLQLW